jgi:hypothetical protein
MTKARDLADNAEGTKPKVVDAKGDLIVGTGSDAADNLAAGNNGETLVADSSTSTGLKWAAAASVPESLGFTAGKNKIINGDFRINQRGFTTLTNPAPTYTFDRFFTTADNGTNTYSAQTFTPGAAPVSGYEAINFVRLESTGQTATSAQTRLRHNIEDVRTFAGETVTVSFWAKASTGTPDVAVNLNQNFGSGGSTAVAGTGQKFAITTSWVRYSKTFTIASISGKTIGTGSYLNLNLWTSAGSDIDAQTDSIGIQSVTIDFWGVQVEAGSVATAFQTATGTLAGELAACQRYYYRISKPASANLHGQFAVGSTNSATTPKGLVHFPVAMRVPPTTLDYANISFTDAGNGGTLVVTNITTGGSNGTETTQYLAGDTTGTLVAYSRVYFWGFYSTTNTKYIGWSAEL